MKNKETKTKFEFSLGLTCHLISRTLCLGAVILICASASAQNLFVTGGDAGGGKILKFTWDGVRSTFASGLSAPGALTFDMAGNVFVAAGGGQILKFTPDGVQSTFASGLDFPIDLAFDSTGNLFVADYGSGNIYKFTPSGLRTTFVSGLSWPEG